MILVTKATQRQTVAARWKKQYRHCGEQPQFGGVGAKLAALGTDPSEADILAVLPRAGYSWLRVPECEECGKGDRPVVRFDETDDEYAKHICSVCLALGLQLVRAERGEQ